MTARITEYIMKPFNLEEAIWKDSTKDYILSKRALVFLEREGARKQAFKMIDTLNKNDY